MIPSDWPGTKKLKRGLQDLSPLFQTPPSPSQPSEVITSLRPSFEVQFLTVCVPDHEGDAFLANAYLASQVVRQANLFASLVSVVPGFNALRTKPLQPFPSLELLDSRISRLVLSHQELWTYTQNGSARKGFQETLCRDADPASFLIFLEFEPSQFRSLSRLALLLDRVILFVQPRPESLREAYRLMKVFWNLNREIEFFLLFRGRPPAESQKEFLFERFALITSRFLGVSTGWLGDLAFPEKNGEHEVPLEGSSGFNPEPVLSPEGLRRPLAPEKIRFWHELRQILRTRFQ